MKSKKIAGYLFSALMLTCFQQASAHTTYNGSVAKPQGQMKTDQMGMAPRCDNQGNWDLWADFLWWSSNLDQIRGFETVVSANPAPPSTPQTVNTRVHYLRPGSHWDPGVRVGLGWNTGYDNWDLQGYWTYFYNSTTGNGEHSHVLNGTEGLFGQGRAKNRLRYNAADFEIGKAYYVSRHFIVRPFTGLHAIWTSLHSTDKLRSGASITVNVPVSSGSISDDQTLTIVGASHTKVNFNVETWGIGPRMGLNTNWGDFRGLSLLSNISTSFLYGKLLGKGSVDIDATNTIDVGSRDKEYWQIMPAMQMQFGASYATCFSGGENQFRISAMWETNFIWEAANLLLSDKPISMQGLTVDIRFDF